MANPPSAFVSYAWHDDEHKALVKQISARLREDGIDVTLDQWHAVHGDQLPEFMERAVRDNEFVLIMCTPRYKEKSDNREGGVGYEGDIMTAEVLTKRNHRKFIPVLCNGSWDTSLPTWLSGKYGVDLSADPYSEDHYGDLLNTLLGTREPPPPIGKPPEPSIEPADSQSPSDNPHLGFEPIRILGVVVDEVGRPRNDGTLGCALYEVPFRLSGKPPVEWAQFFIEAWNNPPRFTMMHRPGTANVVGTKVILARTTMDEVERTHRPTLKLALKIANEKYELLLDSRRREAEREREQLEEHMRDVNEVAGRLDFD